LPFVLLLVACSSPKQAPTSDRPAASKPRVAKNTVGESNIERADYIGPDACGECHPAQQALWSASLHRVMNAKAADPGAVIGDFSGVEVRYRAGIARFERTLGGFAMTLRDGAREVRYRITRTIGHRGLQEYVGIAETESPGPHREADEVRLPFGWWPRAGGWVPQVAFDPWLDEAAFDPFTPVREPWAERCPWCHSTYPFAQRIARSSGPKRVGHGLEQFVERAPVPGDHDRLAVDEQVTTGISCESCHLGGRAHADGATISALPAGTSVHVRDDAPRFPPTFAAQRTDAHVVNTICAQCHSGPSPRLADGTALRNSSEALDLAASSCTGIKCTDCHDPHVADSRGDESRALGACVKCHTQFAAPDAAVSHAGAGHLGTNCLDCHMPRTVMGIDRYVRTHRISSPTNPALLADGSPNACNLCHLDRPIDWTLDELDRGWETKLVKQLASTPRLSTAYGGRDNAVGEAWLGSKSPAIRLIATHAYARTPKLAAFVLPKLRAGLADPLAYVRAWTKFALDELKPR
jgi:hypothetical protein